MKTRTQNTTVQTPQYPSAVWLMSIHRADQPTTVRHTRFTTLSHMGNRVVNYPKNGDNPWSRIWTVAFAWSSEHPEYIRSCWFAVRREWNRNADPSQQHPPVTAGERRLAYTESPEGVGEPGVDAHLSSLDHDYVTNTWLAHNVEGGRKKWDRFLRAGFVPDVGVWNADGCGVIRRLLFVDGPSGMDPKIHEIVEEVQRVR